MLRVIWTSYFVEWYAVNLLQIYLRWRSVHKSRLTYSRTAPSVLRLGKRQPRISTNQENHVLESNKQPFSSEKRIYPPGSWHETTSMTRTRNLFFCIKKKERGEQIKIVEIVSSSQDIYSEDTWPFRTYLQVDISTLLITILHSKNKIFKNKLRVRNRGALERTCNGSSDFVFFVCISDLIVTTKLLYCGWIKIWEVGCLEWVMKVSREIRRISSTQAT